MGRPKLHDEPRVTTAIRLPLSLRDELHDVARTRDVSVNYLVNRAVVEFLQTLPHPDSAISSENGGQP